MSKLDNSNISKHLGKSSEYACFYDSSLLVREPRSSNRTHLDLQDDNLPFIGNDTWNGYEVTALSNNGLPFFCVVKFTYPCDSKYIVESKSLKLYFNSFSMTKLGDTQDEVFASIKRLAEVDLSELLETEAIVEVFSNSFCLDSTRTIIDEWNLDEECPLSHITIEDTYPIEDIVFEKYLEDPSLLRVIDAETPVSRYHSALLRSRCRVTAQPDSGDVFVHIKGDKTVDPISLLEYIVSFRDECHFHEEICEAIYKRLWDLLEPVELNVTCLYARRGGWDICPERASDEKLLHASLGDASYVHVKMPRQ